MEAYDCCLHILRLLIVLNERIHHLFSLAQVVRINVLMSEVVFYKIKPRQNHLILTLL